MNKICFNGNFIDADECIFKISNRSFRYGDGLFETMKCAEGKILLESFHWDRLFTGLKLLQISADDITPASLTKNIQKLCEINSCTKFSRIRLQVYRNLKGDAEYVIEAVDLDDQVNSLNERGWKIDVYPFARKSCDAFSNLKTANYLPYVLADIYLKEKELDEVLIINSYNNICDASKMNIFLIKQKKIFTPALDQGCINGVMRRFIIQEAKREGYAVYQTEISEGMLLDADEIFLTNAIQGVKWVRYYKEKEFVCSEIKKIISLSLV